jgi:hypothetical protein
MEERITPGGDANPAGDATPAFRRNIDPALVAGNHIGSSGIAVLTLLIERVGDGDSIQLCQWEISEATGLSEGTIKRVLPRLEAVGLIRRHLVYENSGHGYIGRGCSVIEVLR